jgi:hypothetical protein
MQGWLDRVLAVVGTLGALALVFLLLVGVWEGHQEALRHDRRNAELEREKAQRQGEIDAMRAEIRALEEDPVYIESALWRAKMIGPGEKLVGRK